MTIVNEIYEGKNVDEEKIILIDDELYGNLLLNYINNHPLNIKLTKMEL